MTKADFLREPENVDELLHILNDKDETKPAQESYKYYSTQRPVAPGTYPKSADNPPLNIENYDGREAVEGGAFQAWGELTYAQPLTQRQTDDYELKPSRDNPMEFLYKQPDVHALIQTLADKGMENEARNVFRIAMATDVLQQDFGKLTAELAGIRQELTAIREKQPALVRALSGVVQATEHTMQRARETLDEAREGIKQASLAGINGLAKICGIKESLQAIHSDLSRSIEGTDKAIDKIGAVGKELREVGNHTANVGRAVAGKELKDISGEPEGKITAAILKPFRSVNSLLHHMEWKVESALKNVERLENTVAQNREKKSVRQALKEAKEAGQPERPEKPDKTRTAKPTL